MGSYLTESAYQRWYRQYQVNQEAYIEKLDALRIRVDNLPLDIEIEDSSIPNKQHIEEAISIIDEALEEAIPRDFSLAGNPISGEEKFSENCKVLVNLVRRACHKPNYFEGIYQEEKNRVQEIHKIFRFKEKIIQVRDMVEKAERIVMSKIYEERKMRQGVTTG